MSVTALLPADFRVWETHSHRSAHSHTSPYKYTAPLSFFPPSSPPMAAIRKRSDIDSEGRKKRRVLCNDPVQGPPSLPDYLKNLVLQLNRGEVSAKLINKSALYLSTNNPPAPLDPILKVEWDSIAAKVFFALKNISE